VIIYSNPDAHDGRKNRGFCFVDFTDHKAASDAKFDTNKLNQNLIINLRRRISMGKIRPWNTDLVVDWAEQQDEPDEEIMAHVKVLYVRNLKEAVNDQRLKDVFGTHGEIEKIKRIKDYAFLHFKERDSALKVCKLE
jgi:RNA recognition motif-containing protein